MLVFDFSYIHNIYVVQVMSPKSNANFSFVVEHLVAQFQRGSFSYSRVMVQID